MLFHLTNHLAYLGADFPILSPEVEVAGSSILIGPVRLRPILLFSVMQMTNLVLNLTLTVYPLLHNEHLGGTLIVIVIKFIL